MTRLRIFVVTAAALAACLGAGEIGRRVLDGYSLWSPELRRNPASLDLTWSAGRSTEAHVRQIKLDLDADPAWFAQRPPAQSKVAPEWAEKRRVEIDPSANYVWNGSAVSQPLVQSYLESHKGRLSEFFAFRAPFADPRPTYRFHPHVETGSGFTNSFGWRGREISRERPGNVIRIAMLGDSTTNAYPGMVEHWLNLWSVEHHLGATFEVINAARPGSSPLDAAAVLDYELAAVDIDYVVLYASGSDIYLAESLIALPAGVERGKPTPVSETPPWRRRVASAAASLLEPMSRWSAIAVFERSRLMGAGGSQLSPEPPKPESRVSFPTGIDEQDPSHEFIADSTMGGIMGLGAYLRGLRRIDALVKKRNLELFVSTFRVAAFDGMLLATNSSNAGGQLYRALNEQFWWPYTYAEIERLMAFYNRTLRTWTAKNGHHLIAIDEQMPRRAELYADTLHELPAGEALHAWIVLQQLMPQIRRDLASGARPRSASPASFDEAAMWRIERRGVAEALAAGVTDAYALPPEPADEVAQAFPLAAIRKADDQAAITAGPLTVIRTSTSSTAYAASIPLDAQRVSEMTGRGWVGVRLNVLEGGVAIGLLNKSADKFIEQMTVDPSRGLHDVYLVVEDLADIGSVMFSNNRPGATAASSVEIHGITVKRFQR